MCMTDLRLMQRALKQVAWVVTTNASNDGKISQPAPALDRVHAIQKRLRVLAVYCMWAGRTRVRIDVLLELVALTGDRERDRRDARRGQHHKARNLALGHLKQMQRCAAFARYAGCMPAP
jgi:hypothetical protein